MTFDSEVDALGPRPQPVRGGASWHADRQWFIRYLSLFPRNADERLTRYMQWMQSHRGEVSGIGLLGTIARNGVQHAA